MVSKNQIKLITGLQQKKYRNKNGLFIVEGEKSIAEFLNSSYTLYELYSIDSLLFKTPLNKTTLVTPTELKKISSLKNPNKALAIFTIPIATEPTPISTIVLDNIRDPGNLGTIIRLCDWFGITQLICSTNTVDCYNSKVVQATMGSLTRVSIFYKNIENFLSTTSLPIYGAVMQGENIYQETLKKPFILVMGNEANGISNTITKYIQHYITIPQFGTLQATESLNVATATAIILSEFMRPEPIQK